MLHSTFFSGKGAEGFLSVPGVEYCSGCWEGRAGGEHVGEEGEGRKGTRERGRNKTGADFVVVFFSACSQFWPPSLDSMHCTRGKD